ncbi:DUF3467 domain-containing protein [Lederbergia galactosidilytica]|uniref:Uncharacterized protein n=1 Tax=Lederbergia galactosidilytica TaxID=217031 RepID=A0A177ZQ65_9BACI|nr:DUF3467 domain-containing protein [Lederbergia galactosidilytica]OAK70107.1 hypothetical protein ABB05_13095 [Lederbergia galactosidilytica]
MVDRNNDLRIAIDLDTFKTEFAERVQVETSGQHVILSFLQMIPGATEQQSNAKIVSRIALTWPQFALVSDLLSELKSEHKQSAQDTFVSCVVAEKEVTNVT